MTSKRSSTDSPTSNNVVTVKRPKFNLDSEFRFTPTSQEELDIGILRIQNKRLSERLNQRKRIEEELRTRIETLEKKQLNDDTKFYVIIRYWNQLNDNVRVILEKFDPSEVINSTQNVQNEDSNESTGPSSSGEDSASFWRQLQNIDKEEMEQSLQQRVQLSTSAVGNIVAAFEKILQRNEKVSNALKGTQSSMETSKDEDCQDIKSPKDDDDDDVRKRLVPNLDESVRELNEELTKENRNLHNLVTSLHQKHHTSSLKQAEFKDKLELKDNQIDEFKNRIDELEFELNQAKTRCQRLENHLYEAREKIQDLKIAEGASEACKSGEMTSYSTAKIDDLKRELEEQKELALSRLTELEQLNNSHRETLKMVEKYKMDLHCIPDSVIRESPEYKSLQSNFSVLYNQSSQIKTQMDEARNTLMQVKNEHLKQIEQMEADELSIQKELKDKLLSMDDSYAQVRKDYDMLRIEFEQTLAANEQNSPIHREIRALVTSSQTYSQQLKDENARIKKKLKEAHGEIGKLKSIIEQNGLRTVSGGNLIPCTKVEVKTEIETKPVVVKSESDDCDEESSLVIVERSPTEESKKALSPSASSSDTKPTPETPSQESHLSEPTGRSKPDEALIRELKIQLKKEQDSKRELKIMLDMFKSLEKEKREKAQIMINEKKVRMELDELKKQHKNLSMEADRRGDKRRVVTPDEFTKKVVKFEEIISQLESKLSSAKQEEEALLLDMDLTGTAFEDMREQNTRLIQQLREKDDANFKIISERIKLTQINKMYAEEKEAYSRQVIKTGAQLEAQVLVIQKLEEKERIYLNTIASMEKEIQLRQQAVDSHKRRALEFAQQVADLKLHLEKYVVQIRDAQSIVADKTSAWQQEAFKTKRLQEEVQGYKRKYERAKKFELAATADEVLHEEIRELKEQLTCPSCKTKRKDAVLNKCFHVFCYDCLKTRYETRQRKCPKCNQSFSANDFHRLYLG